MADGCGTDGFRNDSARQLKTGRNGALLDEIVRSIRGVSQEVSRLARLAERATGNVRVLDLDSPSAGYQWRHDRSRACEYVADFERIGRNALRRAEWKGRLKLFENYFINGLEYRSAISAVGVAEGTFDYWFREVKRAVGAQYSRTGLFPPPRYFGG